MGIMFWRVCKCLCECICVGHFIYFYLSVWSISMFVCVSLYPDVAGLSLEGLAPQCVIFYV